MKISIIIPVYNSEKYLEACLDSIFMQSFQDFEILCINDGSTDGSQIILNQYKQKYPYQMQIKTISNSGQANARNVGLLMAKGEYITFVDSDDTINPYLLEKLFKAIDQSHADLAICDLERKFDENIKKIDRVYKYDTYFNFNGVTTIHDHPEIICYLFGAPYGKLIRKEFLTKNKISFLKGYIYEDQLFTQTILSSDPKIIQVPERLYNYYVHTSSTMTSKNSKVSDMFMIYRSIFKQYEKNGIAKEFKSELDYLCLYHVMIGTAFRLWRNKQCGLFEAIRTCSKYANDYQVEKHNRYLKEKGLITMLYIFLFYKMKWKKSYES